MSKNVSISSTSFSVITICPRGKVMERCVFKHIHNYLLENNIIINNQSGFTKGDSAIYQLINITNDFSKALDEGKEVRVIFCDISKAFDRVCSIRSRSFGYV
jgi:hypothetical protein